MPHKKKGGKKSKRSGEERKQKVKDEILLFAHAQTLKAVIWHQEQKLVQCSTCKQRFGQYGLFLARHRPKNGLTRFKRHFLAKCPGVSGLNPNMPRLVPLQRHLKMCEGVKVKGHYYGNVTCYYLGFSRISAP